MADSTASKRLHWFAPCLAIGSHLAGILLAAGHDRFYMSLNGSEAAGIEYNLIGNRYSKQQFNLAIGTTFAFLVRSMLALSISVAFCQLFWRVATTESDSKRPPTLKRLDVAHSASSNILNIFCLPIWYRYPVLCCVAAAGWLIPIASIITPATLSVAGGLGAPEISPRSVPSLDFQNLNYVAGMPGMYHSPGWNWYEYTGPSTLARQIAMAVGAQGAVLPITAPAPNSSWDLTFRAPSIRCDNVSRDRYIAIEQSMYDYLSDYERCSTPPVFLACFPRPGENDTLVEMPYVATTNYSGGAEEFLTDADAIFGLGINVGPTGFVATNETSFFVASFPGLATTRQYTQFSQPTVCFLNVSNEGLNLYNTSTESPLGVLGRNDTILQCRLLNSTYKTRFEYVNGAQQVTIDRPEPIQDTKVPLLSYLFGPRTQDSCDRCCVLNTLGYNVPKPVGSACIFDRSLLDRLAYQGALQAFTTLITGHWTLYVGGMRQMEKTRIGSTALIHTKELAFLTERGLAPDPVIAKIWPAKEIGYLQGMFNRSLGGTSDAAATSSRKALGIALEEMFQNMVVSFMSSPDLGPDPTTSNITTEVDVSIQTWQTTYSYARTKLWLAYGIAIALNICALIFGAIAMLANNATYSNIFSTVLLAGHGSKLSVEVADSEKSGKDPLPAYLERATIRLMTGKPMVQEMQAMTGDDVNRGLEVDNDNADAASSTQASRSVRNW